MLGRVNAFLEAIDKKSEQLADAAAEEDIARAIEEQQQQQQRLRSGGPSSATLSPYHSGIAPSLSHMPGLTQPPSITPPPPPSSLLHGAGLSGTPVALTPIVSLRSSARPQGGAAAAASPGVSTLTHADAGGTYNALPLSLPTRLPSFRPATAAEEADESTGRVGGRGSGGGAAREHVSGVHSSSGCGVFVRRDGAAPHPHGPIKGSSIPVEEAGAADAPSLYTASPSTVAVENSADGDAAATWGSAARGAQLAALERLQARCAALETEKSKWQHEAATHKAQCSAARDALWKAEQEARSCRAARRDAEQALTVYKETSQRLLEEAQQDVRRAQAERHGGSSSTTGQERAKDVAEAEEELAQARAAHQRLELLQAEHTSLLSELTRHQQEAAKAATELEEMQRACRQSQTRIEALELEVQATHELLRGEEAAHADTRNALRAVQAQRDSPSYSHSPARPSVAGGVAAATPSMRDTEGISSGSSVPATTSASGDEAASASLPVDVARLQRELREARQRQQMSAMQLSNKQALLESAEREAADLKARYNELARQFDDAQVEVAAGFRSPAYGPGPTTGAHRSGGVGGVSSSGFVSSDGHGGTAAAPASSSAAAGHDHLRRNPAMVQLARQYGAAGRGAVAALCAVDGAALRLGRALTQSRWVWRVMLMGYISLLQTWVVLLVLVSMASEEQEAR